MCLQCIQTIANHAMESWDRMSGVIELRPAGPGAPPGWSGQLWQAIVINRAVHRRDLAGAAVEVAIQFYARNSDEVREKPDRLQSLGCMVVARHLESIALRVFGPDAAAWLQPALLHPFWPGLQVMPIPAPANADGQEAARRRRSSPSPARAARRIFAGP